MGAAKTQQLLVSVRSAAEVEPALAGGAALIDVKEPARGSLGRADDATIAAVIRAVGGRWPVSAAFGELLEANSVCPGARLSFAKWGLAGCAGRSTWRSDLSAAARQLRQVGPNCRPVAVAYADWQRADAPKPTTVLAFAGDHGFEAVLVDTWQKDGKTLLDWMSLSAVHGFCAACRRDGIRVALAGSLGLRELEVLLEANPDWFAVRGAVCRGGRGGRIDPAKVRALAGLLAGDLTASTRAG